MIQQNPSLSRRNALRAIAGTVIASTTGCLADDGTPSESSGSTGDQDAFQRVAVEDTELVIELSSADDADQINLIQPDGELFGQRQVATGSQQVSFELGTSYEPGEYTVVALRDEESIAERSTEINPELQIREVGLYRNNPEKPWDEIYGDTEDDRLKNGQAFVTVANEGSGPEAVVELVFSGDVPHPIEDPRGSGIFETEQIILSPGETIDLFSSSFPFGMESEEGMGCSIDGNSGQFTVSLETRVAESPVSHTFDVQYSGSSEMSDCEVTITVN